MNEKIARKIMLIDLEHFRKLTELGNVVGDYWDYMTVDLDPPILDLLGVPEDTYNDDTQQGFCRDSWSQEWFECMDSDLSAADAIDRFIEFVSKRLKG